MLMIGSNHSARFAVQIELSLIMWQTPQGEMPKCAELIAGSKDGSLDDDQRISAPTVAPMLLKISTTVCCDDWGPRPFKADGRIQTEDLALVLSIGFTLFPTGASMGWHMQVQP